MTPQKLRKKKGPVQIRRSRKRRKQIEKHARWLDANIRDYKRLRTPGFLGPRVFRMEAPADVVVHGFTPKGEYEVKIILRGADTAPRGRDVGVLMMDELIDPCLNQAVLDSMPRKWGLNDIDGAPESFERDGVFRNHYEIWTRLKEGILERQNYGLPREMAKSSLKNLTAYNNESGKFAPYDQIFIFGPTLTPRLGD